MYTLESTAYFNHSDNCYSSILTVNSNPDGPLKEHVRQIKLPDVSQFNNQSYCNDSCDCVYAVLDFNNKCDYLKVDKLSKLIEFLLKNNYTIDYNTTKLLSKSQAYNSKNMIFIFNYSV